MNKQITLLTRAKMSTLNAIRVFGATDAEPYFQQALLWINRAIAYTKEGRGGDKACMMNAVCHLQDAAKCLGFAPVAIAC